MTVRLHPKIALQGAGIGLIAALPLVIAAPLWTPERYTALASAIQTVAVVIALFVAIRTYQSDSGDRRVDRVLALHAEYFDAEFQAARRSLVSRLREGQLPYENLTQKQLSDSEYLARIQVLRFFQRVEAAMGSASLDERLAAGLLGSHAAWWDLALEMDDRASRRPLHRLADWANDYAAAHPTDDLFQNWGRTRKAEFGATRRPKT